LFWPLVTHSKQVESFVGWVAFWVSVLGSQNRCFALRAAAEGMQKGGGGRGVTPVGGLGCGSNVKNMNPLVATKNPLQS
jgi:hypothetical protein